MATVDPEKLVKELEGEKRKGENAKARKLAARELADLIRDAAKIPPYRIAVHCAENRLLETSYARDLGRAAATERACNLTKFLTVDIKEGLKHLHDDARHVNGSINDMRRLFRTMNDQFCGENGKLVLSAICMEYLWILPSWTNDHWTKVFHETLPAFVEEPDNPFRRGGNVFLRPGGSAFFPSCTFRQIGAHWNVLGVYFDLIFVFDPSRCPLWRGTDLILNDGFRALGKNRKLNHEAPLSCELTLRQARAARNWNRMTGEAFKASMKGFRKVPDGNETTNIFFIELRARH